MIQLVVGFVMFLISKSVAIQNSEILLSTSRQREARGLYPPKGGVGVLVALAIPIDLPNRHVFYSYNFETNFGIWTKSTDWFPGILDRFNLVDETNLVDIVESRNLNCDEKVNNTCVEQVQKKVSKVKKKKKRKKPIKRDVWEIQLGRREFYKILIDKFHLAGYDGMKCLLRTVCEVNENSIDAHNGVIGSIFSLIFSPASSQDEKLPASYYEAENDGMLGNCKKYRDECKESILDLITEEHPSFKSNK